MKPPQKNIAFHKNLETPKSERPLPTIGVNADLAIDELHIENCIKKGELISEDIGKTLAKIASEKKYPERTFELYMKRRWKRTVQWGYLMIKSYENVKNFLQTSVDTKQLSSKSQVSELSKAAPEKQKEILDEVAKEGKVTAKKIAEKIKEKERPKDAEFRVVVKDLNDAEVPEEIAGEFQKSREKAKQIRTLLLEVRRLLKDEQFFEVELSRTDAIQTTGDLLAMIPVIAGDYICPFCKGKKCRVCGKRGFVSRMFYTQSIPDDKK
jgi:hypothetical protein